MRSQGDNITMLPINSPGYDFLVVLQLLFSDSRYQYNRCWVMSLKSAESSSHEVEKKEQEQQCHEVSIELVMLCSILLLLLPHPFNGLLSQTTWVSRYQTGKISLDLNEARYNGVLGCSGISWTICKQSAPHSRQITTPTPHCFVLRCFNTVGWVPGRTSGL